MFRTMFGSVVLAAALAASPASAQTGTTVVGKAPGKVAMAQTVKATATITAIDAATRAVTLKGPKGNEMVVTAGPEVKNFAQIKVGDQVNVEYVESLALELKKGGGAPVAATVKEGAAAAKPGERPAGMVGPSGHGRRRRDRRQRRDPDGHAQGTAAHDRSSRRATPSSSS